MNIYKSKNTKLIALTLAAILLVITPTLSVGGCTVDKCGTCNVSGTNKYCSICKNSLLKITTRNSLQECEGTSTGTPNCLFTAYNENLQKVICAGCQEGFSLKIDSTAKTASCLTTSNSCVYGEFTGNAENCIECKNAKKFQAHELCSSASTLGGAVTLTSCSTRTWVYKCVDNTAGAIDNCQLITPASKNVPQSSSSSISVKCSLCNDGFVLSADELKCVKINILSHNSRCLKETNISNNCKVCNIARGYYSVDTDGSTQTCQHAQAILRGFLGLLVFLGLFSMN